MKQTFIAIALLIAIGSTSPMMAQSHRHTPRASVQVDAQKNGNTTTATIKVDAQDQGIDAFSDTTAVDSSDEADSESYYNVRHNGMDYDMDDDLSSIKSISTEAIIPIVGILVIFVLAPVLIIGLVCYYLYKSRKQKIRLAELALEKGQPIPDGVINDNKPKAEDQVSDETLDKEKAGKGIRNAFLGLGLALLGLCIDVSAVIGVGLLVACMGAGQFTTVYFFKKKEQKMLEWRQ